MTQPEPQSGAFDQAHMYVWVRGLESKLNNLLREVDLLKGDFMKKQQSARKELKMFGEEITELQRQQDTFSQKMDLIVKEIKQTAGKEELNVIKKYIEFWNPMNFVTQRDLERTLEAATGKKISTAKEKISPFQ